MRTTAQHMNHHSQEGTAHEKQHGPPASLQEHMTTAGTSHLLLESDDMPPEAFVATERLAREAETFDPDHALRTFGVHERRASHSAYAYYLREAKKFARLTPEETKNLARRRAAGETEAVVT